MTGVFRRRAVLGAGLASACVMVFASAGCGGGSVPAGPPGAGASGERSASPPALTDAEYSSIIASARQRKEEFFRSGPDSPVPVSQRASLKPLEYFPVDPTWRLTPKFNPYPHPGTLTLITSTGESRMMQREGWIEFSRDGETVRLNLYRGEDQDPSGNEFWVPFIDALAGKETYPAGRYVDAALLPDGTVLVDFNQAYNPYCAYGWAFSCPLTPRENRITIAVAAGERGWNRDH